MSRITVQVRKLDGTAAAREIDLPPVFDTPVRPDVIRRAVVTSQSHRFQPQGRNRMAGKRSSAKSMGVGHGLSRVPRLKGSSRAAFAPSTVGGRVTHPPRVDKRIVKRLNKKERRYAVRSAIAATGKKEFVERRGHSFQAQNLPIVVSDEIETLQTASEVRTAMTNLGVWADIERVKFNRKSLGMRRHARGKGKRHAIGPLIVVSNNKGIGRAARSFEGVDVVEADRLNTELLAPGTLPGRLTIWSESALKLLRLNQAGKN